MMAKLNIRKLVLFLLSLFLFTLSIQLMKEGARDLVPLLRNRLDVNNASNALGFGCLFAYLILSGSPVAAAALTFFDAGALDQLQAFTMVVLFIGFVYLLRGSRRITSLSTGLLSLVITSSVHLVSLPVGCFLLTKGLLDSIQVSSGALLTSAIDLLFDPLVRLAGAHLPGGVIFIGGLGIIVGSFELFDKSLPEFKLEKRGFRQIPRLIYRPPVMFVLGMLITLISMSVSLSLSILVPLSVRGYIRRENAIPYIMGTNISTFIDTLIAALILNNSRAFTVVLAEMGGVALVSLVILFFCYHRYERAMLTLVSSISGSNRNLALFVLTILVVPAGLLFI
ncbi:MAG: hypothetical protein U9Q78_07410 [Chloroflexota bacterium]|nr:hypothetical protein [Chloroflexota bacterium]